MSKPDTECADYGALTRAELIQAAEARVLEEPSGAAAPDAPFARILGSSPIGIGITDINARAGIRVSHPVLAIGVPSSGDAARMEVP